jgi:hypothetical protein
VSRRGSIRVRYSTKTGGGARRKFLDLVPAFSETRFIANVYPSARPLVFSRWCSASRSAVRSSASKLVSESRDQETDCPFTWLPDLFSIEGCAAQSSPNESTAFEDGRRLVAFKFCALPGRWAIPSWGREHIVEARRVGGALLTRGKTRLPGRLSAV